MPLSLLASGAISVSDIISNSVALFVGIGGMAVTTVLYLIDRKSQRRKRNDLADAWEKRADELTARIEAQHKQALDERDRRIASLETEIKLWRDRWMGVPVSNDGK